jgi:hypothetical protein
MIVIQKNDNYCNLIPQNYLYLSTMIQVIEKVIYYKVAIFLQSVGPVLSKF